MREAVILAAGSGIRLGRSEAKCLAPVAGRPLLAWILDSLADAGVAQTYVIVNPEFGDVRAAAAQFGSRMPVDFVKCADSKLGNGRSAAFAEQVVSDERFFLLMSDHLVSPDHLAVADACAADSCALATCVPAPWIDLPDATKVRSDAQGFILSIGKELEDYNEIDTGVFAMTPALFSALEEARRDGEYSLTAGNQRLARQRALRSAPIGELRWCDVDTPGDLEVAEAWLSGARTRSGRPPASTAPMHVAWPARDRDKR
ncbi:MAG TPA: NTP transferase domain-containing protein [Polyangiales bacterium]|nr:NTP transferase domain-containing protein [Polyangiales bacterium]